MKMKEYDFKKADWPDAPHIVAVYNSNPRFLKNHLGQTAIRDGFIVEELEEMKRAGFISEVIIEKASGAIVGVLDYRPDQEVYLSLLMLHSDVHGNGLGTYIYKVFEEKMIQQNKSSIRIDVVDDYVGHAMPFWKRLNFYSVKSVELTWGDKTSRACVMRKKLL